jgi:hypothetical protein
MTSIEELHTELERLREELPEMRKENRRLTAFIEDALAYIRHAIREEHNPTLVLTTLTHDLSGLSNDEPCFSPRVTGYRQREKEGQLT